MKNTHNFIYQYDAFYCKNKQGGYDGFNIMENADGRDLSAYLETILQLESKDFSDIMNQLLPTLIALKEPEFGFVHADLKAKNIFVATGEENKPIFKIADYDKSSIYFRGFRFLSQSTLKVALLYNSFPIQVADDGTKYYQLFSQGTYAMSWISSLGVGGYIQQQTMYNPYGFYMSYDLYTLMYSLMMEPVVWRYFKAMWTGEKKQDSNWIGWKSMWFEDDFESVMTFIKNKHYELREKGSNRNDFLTSMRSLTKMNETFSTQKWKFKVDVDYTPFIGNMPIPKINEKYSIGNNRDIKISNKNHVCVDACNKGVCYTNKYSQTGLRDRYIYNWDSCNS